MSCKTPYLAKDGNKNIIPVDCGKCPWCLKARASQWSFRLMEHEKVCETAYFLTLTYDTDHVHITPRGFMGLCLADLQRYWKRVRKAHESLYNADERPIRYYAVGEYGGKKFRPHFHAIVFNLDLSLMFPDKQLMAWRFLESPREKGMFNMNCIQWDKGFVSVGLVSGASIGYCMKYAQKPKRIPMHVNDDRVREFSTMSQGIGLNYITNAIKQYHNNKLEERFCCTTIDGKKIKMPRYYKNRIYDSEALGYLKGYFEKRSAEDRKKMIDEVYGGDEYKMMHDHAEGIVSAFANMYKNAEEGRDKV